MKVDIEINFCNESAPTTSEYNELIAKFKKLIAEYRSNIAKWIDKGKIVNIKDELYNKCLDEKLHINKAVLDLPYEAITALLNAGVFDFDDEFGNFLSDIDITRAGIESVARGKKEVVDKFNERIANQNVIPQLVRNKKFSLYNYVLADKGNYLHGICYQNGYACASDNKIMVCEKTEYSEDMEGMSVDENGNKKNWANRKFLECYNHFREQCTDKCHID